MTRPPRTRRALWNGPTVRLALVIGVCWAMPMSLAFGLPGLLPAEFGMGSEAWQGLFVASAFVAAVVGTVIAAQRFQGSSANLAPWVCRHCGYNMHDSDGTPEATCPECGKPWDVDR